MRVLLQFLRKEEIEDVRERQPTVRQRDDDLTRCSFMIESDSRQSNLTHECLMHRRKTLDCHVHMCPATSNIYSSANVTGDSLSRENFTTQYRISIIFDF